MAVLSIIDCGGWEARPVDTSALSRMRAVGVTVHHTTSPNVVPYRSATKERLRCCALARSIQAEHQARGWLDTGQHFLVSRSGLILEGRHGSLTAARQGLVVHGAHAGQDFANTRTSGIECEGLYTADTMPARQWNALVNLIAHLATWGEGFDTEQIFPHRHWVATACPGDAFAARIDELRTAAHEAKLALIAP